MPDVCVESAESLDAVAPERWHAASDDDDFLLSHRWLRSGVEAPSRRAAFFVASQSHVPVAAAAAYLVGPTAFGCYDPNWVANGGHEQLAGPAASYRGGPYPVLAFVAPRHRPGARRPRDGPSSPALEAPLFRL